MSGMFAWLSVLNDSPPNTVSVAIEGIELSARDCVYGIPEADTTKLSPPPLNCVIRGSESPFSPTLCGAP